MFFNSLLGRYTRHAQSLNTVTEHVVTVPIIANRFFRLRVMQP